MKYEEKLTSKQKYDEKKSLYGQAIKWGILTVITSLGIGYASYHQIVENENYSLGIFFGVVSVGIGLISTVIFNESERVRKEMKDLESKL